MNDLLEKERRFCGPAIPLLNSGNWNPDLHPRDAIGEFRYNGGRHRKSTSAPASKNGLDSAIPPHPPNANVLDNMGYMKILAQEIGLYPASLRFYFLVKTDGLWDYKNQPTHGANPAYDPFGNFNYGAAGTALGLSSYTLQNTAGRFNGPGGAGTPGSPFDPSSGMPPYGDRPRDNYWIKKGIEYAHRMGY